MTKFYENGFFLEQNSDKTRLEISDEKWQELLDLQSQGKEIFLNEGQLDVKNPSENYQQKRIASYPKITEFLDAFVKKESGISELITEGEQQLKEYVNSCLAIKKKYPKQ